MNIIIINGSPRKNGITAYMLHLIESNLINKGATTEFYNLSELNISHCLGCCACYKTGTCHIKDDAEELSKKISECDGIVIGSPTYASNVSGLLKDFIDRGHFVIEQLLNNKYVVTVATGENYGNKDTSKILNELVLYSGGNISKSIIAKVPFNGGKEPNSKIVKLCNKAGNTLFKEIDIRKKHIFQSIFRKIIFYAGIRPFVMKKGNSYKGVTEKWKEMEII